MMRVTLVIVLLAAVLAAPLAAADAAERRAEHVLPDRAFSGPGWRFRDVENFREQFRQEQGRARHDGERPVIVPVLLVHGRVQRHPQKSLHQGGGPPAWINDV